MRVVRTAEELRTARPEDRVLTLGNFDGVHLGHRAVVAELESSSRAKGVPAVAVTFEPHPLSVVAPERAPGLLSPLDEKLELLEGTGLDAALVVDFTPAIAEENARTFLAWLGVGRGTHMVLGYDFQMGRDRSCDLSSLSAMGAELGYGLDVVPPVEHDGRPISSSRVRACIAAGDVEDAAVMLGRAYSVSGRVVHGSGIGRRLGSPTANLEVARDKLLPDDGVYFATVETLGGAPGLLYVGSRPTFGDGARVAEVHVLDFEGDLYGQPLTGAVHRRLRGDMTFESEDALRDQIGRDLVRAHDLAGGQGGF